MVDLEQATTSVEWSYVAAVDSVRHSAGKSYGAPGWKVGEERERGGGQGEDRREGEEGHAREKEGEYMSRHEGVGAVLEKR